MDLRTRKVIQLYQQNQMCKHMSELPRSWTHHLQCRKMSRTDPEAVVTRCTSTEWQHASIIQAALCGCRRAGNGWTHSDTSDIGLRRPCENAICRDRNARPKWEVASKICTPKIGAVAIVFCNMCCLLLIFDYSVVVGWEITFFFPRSMALMLMLSTNSFVHIS